MTPQPQQAPSYATPLIQGFCAKLAQHAATNHVLNLLFRLFILPRLNRIFAQLDALFALWKSGNLPPAPPPRVTQAAPNPAPNPAPSRAPQRPSSVRRKLRVASPRQAAPAQRRPIRARPSPTKPCPLPSQSRRALQSQKFDCSAQTAELRPKCCDLATKTPQTRAPPQRRGNNSACASRSARAGSRASVHSLSNSIVGRVAVS